MDRNEGKGSANIVIIAIIGFVVIFTILLSMIIFLVIKLTDTAVVQPKIVVNSGETSEATREEATLPADTSGNSEQKPTQPVSEKTDPVTMYIANVPNSVYFRSEPEEVDSNIITTIAVGTSVLFLKNEGNTFAKVEYNGQTGYIKRDYLSHSIPKKTDTASVPASADNSIKYYKYVVNVPNSVYLRKGPSSDSGYYTTIPLGEVVGFIEVTNGTYSKVSYNGQIGYVTSKYLGDSYSEPNDSYMTVCNVKVAIYLRSEPAEKSGNIICEIPVGSKVKYLDSGNGTFYRISWNGMTGYSKSKYLTW